ncbi:hypothetical protein D3C87_2112920 [compost metagenome]
MQYDLADQRSDVARSIKACARVVEGFGEPCDLAPIDFGDAGMHIGNAEWHLSQTCEVSAFSRSSSAIRAFMTG